MVPRTTVARGRAGEALAASFLTLLGYDVLRRNVRVAGAEIDLVVRKASVVAFVEVKLRQNLASAVESVTAERRRRQKRACVEVARQLRRRGYRLRFDVVAIAIDPERGRIAARHYRHVFSPPSTFDSP